MNCIHMNVIASNGHKDTATVIIMDSANVKFSGFAIIQFIEGADLYIDTLSGFQTTFVAKLLIKLMKGMDIEVKYTHHELSTLRGWLALRIAHCEKEREAKSPKFNIDTYLEQRFLLLDLRELLAGKLI